MDDSALPYTLVYCTCTYGSVTQLLPFLDINLISISTIFAIQKNPTKEREKKSMYCICLSPSLNLS